MPRTAPPGRLLAAAASLAVAVLACGSPAERPARAPQPAPPPPAAAVPDRDVLVIGLDGADWDLIDPLIARGELPHLARLAGEGVRARLRTITPILSPVVWTSIATGKGPDKHGIVDFLARAPDGSLVPVTRGLRRARALWNVLGDGGVPVALTGWWATWPAEPVRGHVATDRIAYQLFRDVLAEPASTDPVREGRGKTWPPSLFDDIAPMIVNPGAVGEDDVARFVDLAALGEPSVDDRERLDELRTIIASTRTYEAIGAELLRRQSGGFHAVYNESTDTLAHLFMAFRPPRRPGIDARRATAFGGVVDAAYREADAMIGRFLERTGPGWNVVVVSDHGFKHGDNRPSTDPRVDHGPGADWHDRFGVLILWGPDVRRGERVADAGILDVAPTLLALYGLPVGEDMDGRVLEEALTPAFLEAHPVGRIATHERGDLPEGEVVPSAQDPELMEKLRALGYIASGADATTTADALAAEPDGLAQDSARAFNNRGVVLLAQHDVDGALEQFDKGLEAGGGVQSLVNIAHVHLIRKDLDRAQHALDAIAEIDPRARALPGLRGAVAHLRGETEAAERLLREAIRVDPADSRAHARLGHILETRGSLDEALAEFEAAVRADPDNAEARSYAGNLWRQRGDRDRAEAAFRKAIETDPRYPGAYNNLGLLLQETGRLDEAVALYRRGLEHAPGSPLLHNSLGSALLLGGDAEAAEREIRRALELDPGMAEAHNNLGILLAERGRPNEALGAFERAVEADPGQIDARFNLAKARLVAGDTEGALRAFVETLERAPGHFQAALGAGETAWRLGRTDESVGYLERALSLEPRSPRLLRRLGSLYLDRGQRARAADAWRRSLALEPDQPDLRRRLDRLEASPG